MIEFLVKNVPVIDVVAKLAGIATVIGLFFAYRQYKHSVRVAERKERRAAVELAARECSHFGTQLLPDVEKLLKQINDCDYLKHCILTKSEDGLRVDASAVTPEDREKIQTHATEIMKKLNSLEGFAIPFAENVADDRVGFIECGRTFVKTIEIIAPFYCFCPLKDYYRSSQALYMRWRKKIEQEDKDGKYVQASKDYIVMSAQMIKERTKSRFWRAVANWCLERAQG